MLNTGLFDDTEPIALLAIAVLHVEQPGPNGDDFSATAMARYRQLLPTGSYLAISHVTDDGVPDATAAKLSKAARLFARTNSPVLLRSRAAINRFMGDFDLVAPGMTWANCWRTNRQGVSTAPATQPDELSAATWAGIGYKSAGK